MIQVNHHQRWSNTVTYSVTSPTVTTGTQTGADAEGEGGPDDNLPPVTDTQYMQNTNVP